MFILRLSYPQLAVKNCSNKMCQWRDSNGGSLTSELTNLSTVQLPLSCSVFFWNVPFPASFFFIFVFSMQFQYIW